MVVTRLRISTRRSLPPTRTASRHMHGSFQGKGDAGVERPRPPPTVTVRPASDRARSCSWEASTTVAPRETASRTRPSRRSRCSASRPAWGSSSSHSSGSRASQDGQRGPPALAGGQGADRRGGQPSRQAQPLEGRRLPPVRAGPQRAPRSARCLPRSGRRRGRSHGRAGRPAGARPGDRPPGPRPAPRPRRLTTRSSPAQARRRLVLPAPFAPWSRTISPLATSKSTPARTGKRPTRATAERKTDHGVHDGHRNGSETGAGKCHPGSAPGCWRVRPSKGASARGR